MKLTDILTNLYAPMTGVSDRTVKLYGYTLRSWAEFLGREVETDDLEELAVAQFLAHRVRTMAAATASKDRAQIRAIWDFCSRRSLCKTWPAVPRVIVPERVPEAWLTDEMRRLLDAAAAEPGSTCGFPMSAVFRAILLVCYDTGERISAVMQLKTSDVRGRDVIFRAEERKGRRRDILREISGECEQALLTVRRGPDDRAIPWDKSETYPWHILKRILKRAGLPTDRRSKFHRIRKTTASYYEAACGAGSAQRLLDHSSARTTKAYLDPRIVRPGAAAPSVLPKVV
jgi:integrase